MSGWPEAIYGALGDLGVRQVGYVPDAGHARLIELCQADAAMRAVALTTEEEGVALLAGETVAAAGQIAFEGQIPVAVLIAQRLIGAKSFAR